MRGRWCMRKPRAVFAVAHDSGSFRLTFENLRLAPAVSGRCCDDLSNWPSSSSEIYLLYWCACCLSYDYSIDFEAWLTNFVLQVNIAFLLRIPNQYRQCIWMFWQMPNTLQPSWLILFQEHYQLASGQSVLVSSSSYHACSTGPILLRYHSWMDPIVWPLSFGL